MNESKLKIRKKKSKPIKSLEKYWELGIHYITNSFDW